MGSLTEIAAFPAYARGDVVRYRDHHNREQTGEVLTIDAHWQGYNRRGDAPLLIYTLRHPTYKGKRIYVGVDDISGVAE